VIGGRKCVTCKEKLRELGQLELLNAECSIGVLMCASGS
jgi:hypothetical protein